MTIDECKEQLESIVDTYEILLGNGVNSDILDVDDLAAIKMAIASLKALEEIRQEAVDAIEDGLYVRNIRILDIINKHLEEGEQNEQNKKMD